jgi:hypothetical protein
MPRFEIVMKPTALPNSFAKYRGPEHRIVVEDYSKHEAVRQVRDKAALSGFRGYAITSVKEVEQ